MFATVTTLFKTLDMEEYEPCYCTFDNSSKYSVVSSRRFPIATVASLFGFGELLENNCNSTGSSIFVLCSSIFIPGSITYLVDSSRLAVEYVVKSILVKYIITDEVSPQEKLSTRVTKPLPHQLHLHLQDSFRFAPPPPLSPPQDLPRERHCHPRRRDAVTYTQHVRMKTVTAMDVVYALKRQGRTFHGFVG
ncbi:hypothetical protein ACLB2K_069587 [Fragaria x ananassa]